MATLYNEIIIDAPVDKIWKVLASPDLLEKYDPTVRRSSVISALKTDCGAKRKVEMMDGKNWFEEIITVSRPNESLTYELTACSFPIHNLKHTYSFRKIENQTKVVQIMEYRVKFGLFGKLMDLVMLRKQSDAGIKKFFAGLKNYIEKQ
jgi:ligand-binding SRPBCC domain-containing protein